MELQILIKQDPRYRHNFSLNFGVKELEREERNRRTRVLIKNIAIFGLFTGIGCLMGKLAYL